MATTFRPSGRSTSRSTVQGWLARTVPLNWETALYIVLLIAALVTRFAVLGDRVMSHDESLHTYYSYKLYAEGNFQHTPLMHGPILFHMTALFYFLFGDSDFSSRIYTSLLGVLTVMFPLLFRRWLGRKGALLASLMILISPLLLYYSRYIRHDTPSIFFTLIMVYCTFMYLDGPDHLKRRARWLYIFAGAMLGSLGSKEVAFMYIAIFGSFMTLYWVVRLIQHFRGVPGRTLMYYLSLPALIGGVTALLMYIVFTIALAPFPTLDGRFGYLGTQFQNLLGGVPLGAEFTAFASWSVVIAAALIGLVVGTGLWVFRRGSTRLRTSEVLLLLALTLVIVLGLIAFEEISHISSRIDNETAIPADPNAETEVVTQTISNTPLVIAWVIAAGVVAVVLFGWRAGWWRVLYRFPEFDILILMGTLILPWLTAFVIKLTGANPTDYSPEGIQRAVLALIPMMAISITMGLVWNWKRWLISAAIFYSLYVFFFTTMFTNPQGLATGMIGSLGYWLEQQGERRGSQPQYYYTLIIMPFYEFLPVIGGFLAMLTGMKSFWRYRRERLHIEEVGDPLALESAASTEAIDPEGALDRALEARVRRANLRFGSGYLRKPPFLLFVSWWAVFNFQAYTLAGEKMPWLGTHLTMPLIFLTAWYFGRVLDRVDWSRFTMRGWLLLLLLPLLFVAIFQAASPFLVGQSPFAGLEQQQLAGLYQWLAMLAVIAVIGALIYLVVQRTGWRHLRQMIAVVAFVGLSLITFRSAWMASFINHDYANEFLVYAHAAPGVKLMMEQIEDISRRTTDGMNIRFAWGGNAWPVTWYFRHMNNAVFFANNPTVQAINDAVVIYASQDIRSRIEPLLEDRYYRFEYMRMWWPMQDYFNLNVQRVQNTFDFASENTQAAEIRRGMFDMWWSRDYARYGRAVGGDYSLQNWPVSERLYFYVRKDVAAQVWNLGTGEGTVMNPLEDVAVNQCTANWQQRFADAVFTLPVTESGMLNHPLDVAVSADGRVYVAEEFANRVSIFDTEGNFISSLNGGAVEAGLTFNRPNGVSVGPNGDLYVADTWNYRIQAFSPAGDFITGWGQPGQYGFAAEMTPVDGLWGPRDVVTDADGNVYVSDTGNKRVRVYNAAGEYLRDIGSGGSGLGQLDEPAGLAVSGDGRLFVADTWNRRVAVFGLDGTALYTFNVRGWYEDLGNRPYLAIDEARNVLYVTDPDAGRVLVYDTQGNCVGSFGQPTDQVVDGSQFKTVGGIATDAQGNVYVSDAGAGRVLRFAPFVDQPVVMPAAEDLSGEVIIEFTPEVTAEVSAEVTDEITAEVTEEAAE